MKLVPIESDATHMLQLTRKDAFEIFRNLMHRSMLLVQISVGIHIKE